MKNIPVVMLLFGGSGDLAHRKLYPALFNLYQKGLIRTHFAVIGTARRPWSHEYFRQQVSDAIYESHHEVKKDDVQDFVSHFYYQSHDVTDINHYIALKKMASELDKKYHAEGNRIFYMAMAPRFFGTIAQHINDQKLTGSGFNRLVIEKPFGHDLKSAEKLNREIRASFSEDCVYRIDHYLGKEMVQNIMPLRMSNPIVKNIWNSNFIQNVQVTLAESLGVGTRGGYYDGSGALRDMVQNHIFQIITLLAMPEPTDLTSDAVHKAKQELLNSLIIPTPEDVEKNFVRGQYLEGKDHPKYLEEDQVNADSHTETFVAGKAEFKNGPLAGVPIYFRTGKNLQEKVSRIDIILKHMSNLYGEAHSNNISIIIDPVSEIYFTINGKKITGDGLRRENLDYRFSQEEMSKVPDGYERLLHDVFVANRLNFTHWTELKQYWKFVDAVEDAWEKQNEAGKKPDQYQPGKLGPVSADRIFDGKKEHWIYD
ncbi:glucose-6-phosphate dehydrogenase [Lactobacillus sp.]|uniref:glucose-6-phosphate dehydrogenase n=1 Tax=Lactobacillus sp. TaxID=1591 RepID=UPI0019A9598A|nr:glucose-6-phosphate dehydrogenase [Lactobacillus sp.]MBD5429976.1 glucose-6-phosphate dehydrogenase [Lactobacillus sp.]